MQSSCEFLGFKNIGFGLLWFVQKEVNIGNIAVTEGSFIIVFLFFTYLQGIQHKFKRFWEVALRFVHTSKIGINFSDIAFEAKFFIDPKCFFVVINCRIILPGHFKTYAQVER